MIHSVLYTAVLDTNVVYPVIIRDILFWFAYYDLYTPKWSDHIFDEWKKVMKEKGVSEEEANKRMEKANMAFPDALVQNYKGLIDKLEMNDEDDRHVLAAAIVGRCDVIVTQNLKDFPRSILDQYGIVAEHPDEFLTNHLHLAPGLFCSAVRKVRARLKKPPYNAEEYLAILTQQGLVATATELTQFSELI